MRPVQTLYYANGQMYCPVHGKSYIKFTADNETTSQVSWLCGAMLPDASHCMHVARWSSTADIADADLRALAVAHMQNHGTLS